MKNTILNLSSITLTTIIYLLGGWDIAIQSLLILMVIDYITGILQAFYNKKVNSRIGTIGFFKKFGYLIIVALSVILDRILGNTGALRTLVIYFFVANDGISILENLGKMNVPLPKKLVESLEQLRKESEE